MHVSEDALQCDSRIACLCNDAKELKILFASKRGLSSFL